MSRLFTRFNSLAPLPRLTVWSFILHGVWEFFQCLFFYDMSGFSVWKGDLWMLSATLADVILTLLLVGGVLWLQRRKAIFSFLFTLVLAGLLVAIGIESLASIGDWWRYAPVMPQLEIAGIALGLFPILQMAFLPYFGAKLAHVNPANRQI